MTDLTPRIARPPPRTRVPNDTALRGLALPNFIDFRTDISYTLNASAGTQYELGERNESLQDNPRDESAPAPLLLFVSAEARQWKLRGLSFVRGERLMPKQWAKVHREAMLSHRLCALYKKSKAALALFWPLKAEADDFGRFTADPAKFAHIVGGLAGLTPAQAESIIDAMEECGVIRRYTSSDGDPLLEILDYHNHESPNWLRLSGPEYEAPDGWNPPDSLVQFAKDHGHLKNVTPSRYGLRPGISPACDELLRLMCSTGVEQVSDTCSTGVGQVPNTTATDSDQTRPESDQYDRAREENEDANDLRADVALEFQQLWPTGIPDDVRDPIMREVDHTDPEIARMAARKTVAKFGHTKFDRWKVRDYFIATAQGMTLDQKGEQKKQAAAATQQSFEEAHLRRQALKAAGELSE